MSRQDLIERLEKATAGSGRLDDDLYETFMGYKKAGAAFVSGGGSAETFWLTGAPDNVICGQIKIGRSPSYTFDINAARSLVESGMLFSVEGNAGDYQQGRYGRARIWCSPEYSKIKSMARIDVEAHGATPALALCIAALKARIEWASRDTRADPNGTALSQAKPDQNDGAPS